MFPIVITLPERRINLAKDDQLIRYLAESSPFKIVHAEVLQAHPFKFRFIVEANGAHIPIVLSRRERYVHFATTVTELPETPATLLQTHMWTKPVTLGLVYPYPIRRDDVVAFTVSGGLSATKHKKTDLDAFLDEFVGTAMFVLQCHYELGQRGAPTRSTQRPDWVDEAARREATGPRASEFDLTPKPETPEDTQGGSSDHPNQ